MALFRERNQSFWRVLQEISIQLSLQWKCIIGFGRRVHTGLSNPPQQYPVHSNVGGRSNKKFPWSCPWTLRSFTAFKELHEEQDHHRQQVALASSKNTWYFGRKSPGYKWEFPRKFESIALTSVMLWFLKNIAGACFSSSQYPRATLHLQKQS